MRVRRASDQEPAQSRPCPVCGKAMTTARRDPVEIDVCQDHGVWLDKGELERINARTRARARRGQHARVARARGTGRLEGVFYGWFSFLMR